MLDVGDYSKNEAFYIFWHLFSTWQLDIKLHYSGIFQQRECLQEQSSQLTYARRCYVRERPSALLPHTGGIHYSPVVLPHNEPLMCSADMSFVIYTWFETPWSPCVISRYNITNPRTYEYKRNGTKRQPLHNLNKNMYEIALIIHW